VKQRKPAYGILNTSCSANWTKRGKCLWCGGHLLQQLPVVYTQAFILYSRMPVD
jgi:hypothetical protein